MKQPNTSSYYILILTLALILVLTTLTLTQTLYLANFYLMQRTAAVLLSDSSGYEALGMAEKEVIRLIEKSEEDEVLLLSVILEYIKARREESVAHTSQSKISERKEQISHVLSMYILFLDDMLECIERKEIEVKTEIESVIARARNEQAGSPSREDKIRMHRQILELHSEIKEEYKLETLLKFAVLDTAKRIHILREEKRVVAEIRSEPNEKIEQRPLQVHKMTGSSHPVRISGSILPQDIKNLLQQQNGPSMSIEEFGDRMMLTQQVQGTVNAEEKKISEDEEENKISEESEETERRKNIRRDEMTDTVFRGEGNMHRRG